MTIMTRLVRIVPALLSAACAETAVGPHSTRSQRPTPVRTDPAIAAAALDSAIIQNAVRRAAQGDVASWEALTSRPTVTQDPTNGATSVGIARNVGVIVDPATGQPVLDPSGAAVTNEPASFADIYGNLTVDYVGTDGAGYVAGTIIGGNAFEVLWDVRMSGAANGALPLGKTSDHLAGSPMRNNRFTALAAVHQLPETCGIKLLGNATINAWKELWLPSLGNLAGFLQVGYGTTNTGLGSASQQQCHPPGSGPCADQLISDDTPCPVEGTPPGDGGGGGTGGSSYCQDWLVTYTITYSDGSSTVYQEIHTHCT